MHVFVPVLMSVLLISSVPQCDCVDPGFDRKFSAADAVFLAKVMPRTKTEWKLEIEYVWKGKVPKTARLRDSMTGTSCGGMRFSSKIRYIVFASKSKQSDLFYTYTCMGTTAIDDELLNKLGHGHLPGVKAGELQPVVPKLETNFARAVGGSFRDVRKYPSPQSRAAI